MAVAPDSYEATLPPGAFRGFSPNLANQDEEQVSVKLRVCGLAVGAEGGFVATEGGKGEWSAADWVRLSREALVLAPGERKVVQVAVTVPKGAPDGTRYAMLICVKPAGKLVLYKRGEAPKMEGGSNTWARAGSNRSTPFP